MNYQEYEEIRTITLGCLRCGCPVIPELRDVHDRWHIDSVRWRRENIFDKVKAWYKKKAHARKMLRYRREGKFDGYIGGMNH